MNRRTTHRRIAAALAAAGLTLAAAAPAADARWFNFNRHGTLVLVTPPAWTSGHGFRATATRHVARDSAGEALERARDRFDTLI